MVKSGFDFKSFSLLVTRIVLALVFLWHGINKLMDVEGTMGGFEGMLMSGLGWLGPVVGAVEVIAGILLLTGLWYKYGAWAIIVIMAGATVFVKLPGPGIEGAFVDLALLACALVIAAFGPGQYALSMKKK